MAPQEGSQRKSPRVPVRHAHNRGHEDFESEDDDERKKRRLEGDMESFLTVLRWTWRVLVRAFCKFGQFWALIYLK